MIKRQLFTYMLVSTLVFSSNVQAQLGCQEVLKSSIKSQLRGAFTASNLIGLEVLASAILASRTGRQRNRPNSSNVVANGELADLNSEINLLESRRAHLELASQLTDDLVAFISNGVSTAKNLDIKRFVKAEARNSEEVIKNLETLEYTLQSPEGKAELHRFIKANFAAIKINADMMPLEHPLRMIFRRSFNRASFVTAALLNSLAPLLATVTYVADKNDAWVGAAVLVILTLGVPVTLVTSAVASPIVGAVWSNSTNKSVSPIFDMSTYDIELGAEIRAEFVSAK